MKNFYTYISCGKVYNSFGMPKQATLPDFNKFNLLMNRRFTQVTALGKTKNYSKVEMLHSIFRGV